MQLDLEPDRSSLMSQIRNAIAKIDSPANPITRIDIQFDLGSTDMPVLWVYLDDDPSGDWSGRANSIFEVFLDHWTSPCHAAIGGQTTAVNWAGRSIEANDEETVCEAVGLFLVDVLKCLRDEGAFAKFPRADRCYLGVGTIDGVWGWPAYEDRGTADDLV